ncbi:MAG: A/G-specific adenine glycosylase [Acidobacteriota bacterium]
METPHLEASKVQNPRSAGDSAQLLLEWYRRQKRDLPWRRSRDPYAIWISEIMLQQTQVVKVVPYFENFLERFPTVEDLAAAPIDEVLALWSGLGYYRRARLLHRAACELASEGRSLPRTAEELQKLPGIGAYTSAAIASIAFGEVVPVLDGNVERVAARRLALPEDPKKSAVKKKLLREVSGLVDANHPGDSNQALMELGATVCRPQSPTCLLCPIEEDCLGKGNPEAYPPPRKRRAKQSVIFHIALVRREEGILLVRRSQAAELFAGMWELPTLETSGKPLGQREAAQLYGKAYGGRWTIEASVGSASHGITHRSITAHVHPAAVEAGDRISEGPEAAWVQLEDLGGYAVSSLVTKALRVAGLA